jgi:hypothetical protein
MSFVMAVGTVVTLALSVLQEAKGMPMFARKYGISCAVCHTSPPRLNETGYRFRAAGFRMPSEIGKGRAEEKFDILNYFSGRVQVRAEASRTKTGATKTDAHLFRLQALEIYPFTGAWGKYFSTNFKVTFTPLLSPAYAIENAHAKVNVGNAKRFLGARIGIFHPYDGYGASDSPATISRPLIQTTPANLDQTTFFRTWGFDQTGAEIGLDYRRTSIRVATLKGVVLNNRDGGLTAAAAQGGLLTRRAVNPDHDGADIQLFVNHVLRPEGGGLSLQYYRGNLSLPNARQPGAFFRNSFDRVGLYGSYPAAKRLHVFAGYQHGRDKVATGGRFSSNGAFVEASVPLNELTAAGARYDWFDPASGKSNNELRGITAYVNAWIFSQVRVVAEYQNRKTLRGAAPTQTDDVFQTRFIYIK